MFGSRTEAGRWLARTLEVYRRDHPVVLGVAGGSLPVAREVSEILDAPLDVVVVQKVPAPGLLDLTLAILTEDGACVLDDERIAELGIKNDELDLRLRRQRAELTARVQRIRGGRRPMDLQGKTVILVHDGIETSCEAEATIAAARRRGAARVVLAAPVSSREALEQLSPLVDDLAWLRASTPLGPVGLWYEDRWEGGEDGEVAQALRESAERPRAPEPPGAGAFGAAPAAFPILMMGPGWRSFGEPREPAVSGRRRSSG